MHRWWRHNVEMMSLPKAAAYLSIGRNAIYGHVRAGRIAVVSLPGRKRKLVTRAALDAFRDAYTGTLEGPIDAGEAVQTEANAGRLKLSLRMTKRRETQLDEVFAR